MLKPLARLRMPRVRLDITYGVPELTAVRDAVRNGNRHELDRLVKDCADADDRSDRVFVAASTAVAVGDIAAPEWISLWVEEEPKNPVAWTFSGAVETLRAWKVRGYARARSTATPTLKGFQAILGDAEVMCREAAALAPEDAVPWVWLVQMARGQEVGPHETFRRWHELTALAPQHLRGHHQMLLSISPKWGYHGSVMDEFVAAATDTAPDGSALHLLSVAAQVEHWLYLDDEESAAYVKEEAQAARARAAIGRWLHSRGTDSRGVISGHNLAAFWHSLRGGHGEAKPHFELTHGYCDQFPWAYLGDPLASYTRHRRKAG